MPDGSDSADARIAFFNRYQDQFDKYRETADVAREGIRVILEDQGVFIHDVTARAKEPLSLLQKLRRKDYANPADEVTDLIGVRVVTYFQTDVTIAEGVLRNRLTIDEANSSEKGPRSDREFGYQSIHLIAELTRSSIGLALEEEFEGRSFEIQVRSILQHSWAEIEHEVVYKAGTTFRDDTVRRFAAAAASLEIVEGIFEDLRAAFEREVDRRCAALRDEDTAWDLELDAAGVVAALRVILRRDEDSSHSVFPEALQSVLSATREAGLSTASALQVAINGRDGKAALERFASNASIVVSEIPLVSVVALLVAARPEFPIALYPDLVEPRHLRAVGSQ